MQVVDRFILPKTAPAVSRMAISVSAKTTVVSRTPSGAKVETLVPLLLRDTFIAEPVSHGPRA